MAADKNKGLTPEELQELQELEELDQLEALEAQGKLDSLAEGEGVSKGTSLLSGLQKGTMVSAPIAGVSGVLGALSGGDKRPLGNIYEEAAQEYKQNREANIEANPVTGNLGQIATGLLIPGMGASKALNVAGTAALQGGIQEGLDTTKKENLLENILKGAGTGFALGKGMQAIGGAAKGAKGLLDKGASALEEEAPFMLKKILKPSKSLSKDIKKEGLDYALEKGLVKPFDTTEDIINRISGQADEVGAQVGKSARVAEEMGGTVNKQQIVDELTNELEARIRTGANDKDVSRLRKVLKNLKELPDELSITDVETGKRMFQDEAKGVMGDALQKQGAKAAGRTYKEASEEAIGQTLGGEELAAFQQAKNEFGMLAPIVGAGDEILNDKGRLTKGLFSSAKDFVGERLMSTAAVAAYKIPRTYEGLKQALPDLIQRDPVLGTAVQQALTLPKERALRVLGPIISSANSEFEDSEYPSLFEGRLNSEEDKAAYSERIKDEMSPIERAKAMSALNKDGAVNLPPPAPIQPTAPQAPVRKPLTTTDLSNNVGLKQRQY